jgi:copper resistance protein B
MPTGRKAKIALPVVVLMAGLGANPALGAQQHSGQAPQFPDEAVLTYAEAEIDYTGQDGGQIRWDAETWIGGDYRKLWLRMDGETHDGDVRHAQIQALYGRYLSEFWDWRAGVRHDLEPRALTYAVLGVKGLAPYRLETDASLYLSEKGDVSIELATEHVVLITQRFMIQPYLDLEVFAQDVPEQGRGAGISEASAGVQLRYEITRQIGPYLDVGYNRLVGETARMARAADEDVEEVAVRAGLRVWF